MSLCSLVRRYLMNIFNDYPSPPHRSLPNFILMCTIYHNAHGRTPTPIPTSYSLFNDLYPSLPLILL